MEWRWSCEKFEGNGVELERKFKAQWRWRKEFRILGTLVYNYKALNHCTKLEIKN
jgi:hypothetical protein